MAMTLAWCVHFVPASSRPGSSYSGLEASAALPLPSLSLAYQYHEAASQSHSLALPSRRRFSSSTRCNNGLQRKKVSVSVCTNPDEVDVEELSVLLAATGQNCEQFPTLLNDGAVAPVDPHKLRCALEHSTVVVALYAYIHEVDRGSPQLDVQPGGGWFNCWTPRRTGKKTLIAFGRATSDHTLTASIYDLVVEPSYQRSGYGSQVLLRIVRNLRLRGISDIAVTPSPELRPFFQHCGFAPDMLKSVTMMYTRTSAGPTVQSKDYGRRSLHIPACFKVAESPRC